MRSLPRIVAAVSENPARYHHIGMIGDVKRAYQRDRGDDEPCHDDCKPVSRWT